MQDFQFAVLNGHQESASAFAGLIKTLAIQKSREEFLATYLRNHHNSDKDEMKRNRLSLGWFTISDLQTMVSIYADINGLNNVKNGHVIAEQVIARFSKYGLITNAMSFASIPDFATSESLFKTYSNLGVLDNITFGTQYVLEKYRKSIPAINVKDKRGDLHCGTGLIVKLEHDAFYVLTNRHVLDDMEIQAVRAGSSEYAISGDSELCDFADLAVIPIENPGGVQHFVLAPRPHPLTPIIAVGYPRIPSAIQQYALFHRGEINGDVETTQSEQFHVISCHVSPGNSGGPIINEIGLCAGVVTQSNSASYTGVLEGEEHKSLYHMAIPVDVIDRFLREIT